MIVEVAYALPDKQSLISLEVREGTTIKEAIEASGVLDTYDQSILQETRLVFFLSLQHLTQYYVKRIVLRFIVL